MIILYCKVEDITLDCEGNICLVLSKQTSKERSIELLKSIKGNEVTIYVVPR